VVVVCIIRISLSNGDRDSLVSWQGKDQSLQAERTCSRFHQRSLIQCTTVNALGASFDKCKHDTFRTESNNFKWGKTRTMVSLDTQEHAAHSNILSEGYGQHNACNSLPSRY
jgi:hypothetical protein